MEWPSHGVLEVCVVALDGHGSLDPSKLGAFTAAEIAELR